MYSELGSAVTVVELTNTLLPGADRDLVRPLQNRLKDRFKEILLETKVESLTDKGDSIEVTFSGAGGQRTERFSRVLVSVGRKPASAGLGLENTQVELDKRGFVIVDRQLRTADPRISAIGDVAGEPMLAHKAMYEGRIAVESVLGEPAVADALAIPAVVFTDPEIAWAGLSEEQAQREGRTVEIARYPWAAIGRAQALGTDRGDDEADHRSGKRACAGDWHRGNQRWRHDQRRRPGDRDGLHGPRSYGYHPPRIPRSARLWGPAAEVFLGLATEIYRPRRERQEA